MIDTIYIEGVDKTGKDLICDYLIRLSNFKYVTHARGVISNEVYDLLYERNNDMKYTLDDHTLYVLLDADKEDLEVRFKITNEPEIKDLNTHRILFNTVFRNRTDGYHHLEFNTSDITPYKISKMILDYLKNINEY